MKHTLLRMILLLFVSSLILSLGACTASQKESYHISSSDADVDELSFTVTDEITDDILVTMQGGGRFTAHLDAEAAPITVENFRSLVASGFYDGLKVHRVVKNFVIQTGNPKGDGTGGSGKTIKGEFFLNGYNNPLKHVRGVLSMARQGYYNGDPHYNSATSQFFICLNDRTASSLDGSYAAFGYVTAGMGIVDAIAAAPVKDETPVQDIIIESIKFIRMEETPAA